MSVFLAVLLVIFFCVLFLLVIGFYLMVRLAGGWGNLKALCRLFMGGKGSGKKKHSAQSASGTSSSNHKRSSNMSSTSTRTSDKVFGANEGTYVDFEDVKI